MKVSSSVLRLCLVITTIGVVDCLWVWFAARPLPIATIIPATTPFWVAVFVIIPMIRKEELQKNKAEPPSFDVPSQQ